MYVYCFVQLTVIVVMKEEMGNVRRAKGGTIRVCQGLCRACFVVME